MLPIRLELHNFLAYRNPDPIYFEGIHLACLSGANGAGKTTILDGITWAIWGKSRARSDDDLIHIGQEEMSVSLEFIQGKERYRIIRKRRLGNKRKAGGRSPGTTMLDLFGWVPEENTYRVISEPSIRQTQNDIIELVGLDYETFIHSAYLQQGQADAFTVQTSGNRKRILTEILNLDIWQEYEKRAKQKLTAIENELQAIRMNIEQIERDLAQEDSLRVAYAKAQAEYDSAHQETENAHARYQEMAGTEQEERSTRDNLHRTKREIERYVRELESIDERIQRDTQQLEQYEGIMERRDNIESGYARLLEAQEMNENLGDKLSKLNRINERIRELENKITAAEHHLKMEIASSSSRIDDLMSQAERMEQLRDTAADLAHDLALLEADEARMNEHQDYINTLREEESRLGAENEGLRAEMNDLKLRIDTLEQDNEDAICPACGQPLDTEHRLRLIEEYRSKGTEKGDTFRDNKLRVQEIKEEITERESAIRVLQKNLEGRTKLQGQLGSLEHQIETADAAEKSALDLQGQVDHLQQTIADRNFAHELQRELNEVLAQREALNYDEGAHSEIKETLDEYREFQQASVLLQTALASYQSLEASLHETYAQRERMTTYLDEQQESLVSLEKELEVIEVRVQEMRRREKEWIERRTIERNRHEQVISINQKLIAIEQQRERLKRQETRRQELQTEANTFETLRNAFSKNGIPTMVIEAAVPELEEATNHLLRRMTDGRLVVRFETQREKRTGGVAETFDIWISDELGTRDYQLYSGGEAFRINFAIRVAVSQLLARRAGAQLRTLFIDEGFGTQDEIGRERLVEAITAIQDDFDLILVITHIDELRDAFPVRIEVEKTDNGSRVRVM